MSSLDLYVVKNGEKLRCGYTTGSCAAAASKAAVIMLDSGKIIDYIEIGTPANIRLKLRVYNQKVSAETASCSVEKDAGDDPDSTDGIHIFSEIKKRKGSEIKIDGGIGIGRITSEGLFGKAGEAAINPVPRQMIKKEVREISDGGYDIVIYSPEGKKIGEKTFNKNIGIEGGISIIGTKGIVYPMSEDALIKTIYMEIDMVEKKYGKKKLVLVPGNYGEKLVNSLNINAPKIKISNYIGDSLLYAYKKGFKDIVLVGHVGKFSKLSIGVFNTHSKICDARMEAFIYYLSFMGASVEVLEKINNTLTAEKAVEICIEEGYGKVVKHMELGAEERIKKYLKDDGIKIKVIIYSMNRGIDIC